MDFVFARFGIKCIIVYVVLFTQTCASSSSFSLLLLPGKGKTKIREEILKYFNP